MNARSEYKRLYENFLENGTSIIEEFAEEKSTEELKAFCKQNNMAYLSKEHFVITIRRWFWVKKLIEEPIKIERREK